MSLTAAEEERLSNLERLIAKLSVLMKGAGSSNQLNRLLVLCQDKNTELTNRLAAAESKQDILLDLLRKAQ